MTIRARAIITNASNEVLLLKRVWNDGLYTWLLPGGDIDAGETIEEGLKRELMEELGIDVTLDGLLFDGVFDYVVTKEKAIRYGEAEGTIGSHSLTFYKTKGHYNEIRLMEPDKFSDFIWVGKNTNLDNPGTGVLEAINVYYS